MNKKDKSALIEEEKAIILKLMGINPRKKKDEDLTTALIRRTVNDLAFMRVELDGLQDILVSEGWQDEYQNGNQQSGTKQNPSAKTYLDVQKLYNQTVQHLKKLAQDSGAATDELLEFLK